MLLTESGSVVLSPPDLVAAQRCEYSFLRSLDGRLGRIDIDRRDNAMRAHLNDLAKAHKVAIESTLRAKYTSFERVETPTRSAGAIASAAEMTIRLVSEGVEVVAQPVLFDGDLFGIADYLIRQPDGTYGVWDAKASRNAHQKYILPLATFAHLMDAAGIPRNPIAGLFLMSGAKEIAIDDSLASATDLLTRVRAITDDRVAASGPITWGDDTLAFCSACDQCAEGIASSDDVMQVFRVTKAQRAHLRAAGISTVTDLATSTNSIGGIPDVKLGLLRAQASLQLRHTTDQYGRTVLAYEVFDSAPLKGMPAPDDDDLFFDFEGDTMFVAEDGTFTIEYLWGLTSTDDSYRHWWADDRSSERDALVEFIDLVTAKRRASPDMHVYHFHHYETTALKRLANKTHQIRQAELQQLLDVGFFVDLRPIVEKSLRTSAPSLGLKAIEPLYLPPREVDGVTDAVASITGYADYRAADPHEALKIRKAITAYNRDDCISTAGLRDWLITHVAD